MIFIPSIKKRIESYNVTIERNEIWGMSTIKKY